MSDTTGDTIIVGTDRIADVDTDNKSANTNSDRIDRPEIINGFETERPRTERIDEIDDIPKRRGRPPGSRNNSGGKSGIGSTDTKEKIRLDSFSIEGLLIGIHQMGSAILKTPELKISKDEAKQLSDAVQAVAKEYNHVVNPKTAAWIQLCVACGAIYGTRIVAIRMRENAAKKIKAQPIVVNWPSKPEPEFIPPDPIEKDAAI